MIKEFCDVCDVQITERNYVQNRLKRGYGRAMVEVIAGMDGTWNKGHICLPCLITAVKDGEDK